MSVTKIKSNLMDSRDAFKPFNYPWAYDAWLKHEQSHWLHTEVPMAEDVKDWKKKLTVEEKHFLTNIFRFFTQGDIDVAGGYVKNYLPYFKQPEVRMMLLGFAAREALHVAAYSHLIETLGLPDTTYNEFLAYQEMKDKHDYVLDISNANGDSGLTAASGAVTATTVPATPGAPSASSPSAGTDSVSWSAPSNGGSAITNYYWTSSDGKAGNTASSSVSVAQEQGTAQTYSVRADNACGSSATSPAFTRANLSPNSMPLFRITFLEVNVLAPFNPETSMERISRTLDQPKRYPNTPITSMGMSSFLNLPFIDCRDYLWT